MAALAALYYYPSALMIFLLPVWGTALFTSIRLNHGVSLRFLLVWLTLTAIIVYGRHILQRWFNEAWQRYQQNRLMIARLDVLAHQDALTGTANRRARENYLESATSQALPFALIMLDMDYFKRYNDHYGHQAGDVCLTNKRGQHCEIFCSHASGSGRAVRWRRVCGRVTSGFAA